MHRRLAKYYENLNIRHYIRVVTFVVLGMFVGGLFMLLMLEGVLRDKTPSPAETGLIEEAYVLPASEPMKLNIPAINLVAEFEEPLGINEDRSAEVPDSYEKVGWYKYGPTPGELGPAVVLGHVDSKAGPAVFYSLGQLKPGDEITIEREDGSIATFGVTELKRYEQDEFPTATVYGDLDHAGLRLVTCTGIFDRGSKRYSHNLVVYAKLKEAVLE